MRRISACSAETGTGVAAVRPEARGRGSRPSRPSAGTRPARGPTRPRRSQHSRTASSEDTMPKAKPSGEACVTSGTVGTPDDSHAGIK